jgi:hypothetical protein
VDLSSNGLISFICREEKGKAAWVMQQDLETGGPWVRLEIGFYRVFYCPRAEILGTDVKEVSRWCKQIFLGKEKGRFSPWLIDFLGIHGPPAVYPSSHPLNDHPNCC